MNIAEFDKCSNCGACVNICPTDAIEVYEDGLFFEPRVNAEKCLSCSKCANVCPVNNPSKIEQNYLCFAGRHKDINVVKGSSSGGAFSALCEAVMSSGGIVYAAAYNGNFSGVIFRNSCDCGLEALRVSKYVESNVRFSFREIKKKLDDGARVMFCGTPCQAAGLVRFLGREYENLLVCDFACGGLPSHKLYKEYTEMLKKKYKSEIASVNFRYKAYGWSEYCIKVDFINGKTYEKLQALDPYFSAFASKHFSVRDNCDTCDFSQNHYSDITLADFWKWRDFPEVKNDNTGLSLVIANNEKGKQYIEKIEDKMNLVSLPSDKACYNLKPVVRKDGYFEQKNQFLSLCESDGLVAASKKYCMISGMAKFKKSAIGSLKKHGIK